MVTCFLAKHVFVNDLNNLLLACLCHSKVFDENSLLKCRQLEGPIPTADAIACLGFIDFLADLSGFQKVSSFKPTDIRKRCNRSVFAIYITDI